MLEGALHLLMQIFHERRSAHGLCAGFADIRGAIAAAQNAHQRLFHPIGFQAQAPDGLSNADSARESARDASRASRPRLDEAGGASQAHDDERDFCRDTFGRFGWSP